MEEKARHESARTASGALGKWDLLALSIGYVIGAGVVTMVGQAIGLTGRSAWLAYLVAILLGTFINIPYLFLTGTACFSGGPYNLIASLTNEKLGGIYVTAFIAQCINFPLQRNITFKSKGNPVFQAIWYFIAWIVISLICNGFNNLWMPIAAAYVAPAVYNILVTIITGGVSMVIFFFVFKIIFPEGEKK